MAAPMKSHETVATSEDEMPRPANSTNTNNKTSPVSSKQLLYSEKFPDKASDRLNILSKSKGGNSKDHKTYKLPPSSVLDQVKGFLPQLKSSNDVIERKVRSGETNDLDIENVGSCSGPVIEMNLALVEMEDNSNSDSNSSDESSSDSDSDNNMDIEVLRDSVSESNLKLTKTMSKQSKGGLIVELQEKSAGLRETTLQAQSTTEDKIVNEVT